MEVYDFVKPIKAIVFNQTKFDDEKLTSRSEEPGQKLVKSFTEDLHINDVEHKLNLTAGEILRTLKDGKQALCSNEFNY